MKKLNNMAEPKWVLITSLNQIHLSQILKVELEQKGIPVRVINKQDSAYMIGDIELYVDGKNVIRAKRIIKDYL